MERLLAEVLGVDEAVTIVTKIGTNRGTVPARKCFKLEFLQQSLDACAARLRPRALDIVLLHNPSAKTLRTREATDWLAALVGYGKLRSWGVSAGSAEVAEAALDVGAPVIELAYNVFWPGDLRAIEERAKVSGTAILARSVLAHGLLAGYFPPDKTFPPEDHRAERWTAEELECRRRQLDALRPFVGGELPTLRALALRWVLSQPLVSSAILGPRSNLQLDQLVRESGQSPPCLSPEILQSIETRLKDLGARP
jgi:aryl-alcohol dehydrogenase-like predicted oxidoreductase